MHGGEVLSSSPSASDAVEALVAVDAALADGFALAALAPPDGVCFLFLTAPNVTPPTTTNTHTATTAPTTTPELSVSSSAATCTRVK